MIKVKKIEPQLLKVVVRVLPQGDEYEIEVSDDTIAQELLEALIDESENTIELESGEELSYTMTVKGDGKRLNLEDTLKLNSIKEGDVILMVPLLLAG